MAHPPVIRFEIAYRYEQGWRLKDIAAKCNVPIRAVSAIARRMGCKPRRLDLSQIAKRRGK